jgi:hypothetical protein
VRSEDKQMKVRMMLPMTVRCNVCGTFMYKVRAGGRQVAWWLCAASIMCSSLADLPVHAARAT